MNSLRIDGLVGLVVASALAAGIVSGAPRRAAALATYTYVGEAFTSATAPFTTSDFVSGTITFAAPLTSLSAQSVLASAIDFSFGAGPANVTLASFDSGPSYFWVSTDAAGNITSWALYVVDLQHSALLPESVQTRGDVQEVDQAHAAGNFGAQPSAWVLNQPGVWTLAVPEPSTVLLLGSALAGLAVRARKR